MILTIYFWGVSVICLIFTFLVCLVVYNFVDQKTFSRTYESFTGLIILYIMIFSGIWSIKVRDRRKDKTWKDIDEKDKQYVVIANHMSFVDSMITAMIPLKKKFMIGNVFTKAPIFGWLSLKSGFIPAEKGNTELNSRAVDRAIEAMKDGSSFFLYPEGQRELIPYKMEIFKTGAFRIAYKTGVPILPIIIKGTERAMPIGGKVWFADIEMIIEEPFYVTDEDYPKWIKKSQGIISSYF